jgi:hypothetical protein
MHFQYAFILLAVDASTLKFSLSLLLSAMYGCKIGLLRRTLMSCSVLFPVEEQYDSLLLPSADCVGVSFPTLISIVGDLISKQSPLSISMYTALSFNLLS